MKRLSVDEVMNVKFRPTMFRQGYDKDDVDVFLDNVVYTLAQAHARIEELEARIAGQ